LSEIENITLLISSGYVKLVLINTVCEALFPEKSDDQESVWSGDLFSLVSFGAFSCLPCSDIVDWITGRASGSV